MSQQPQSRGAYPDLDCSMNSAPSTRVELEPKPLSMGKLAQPSLLYELEHLINYGNLYQP